MSNLGLYQWMTETSKKLGGPANFIIAVMSGGYAVFRTGEAGVKKIIKIAKNRRRAKIKDSAEDQTVYTVQKAASIQQNTDVKNGDKIKVLNIDKDAVLIQVLGDDKNPYVISLDVLKQITDYKD